METAISCEAPTSDGRLFVGNEGMEKETHTPLWAI